MPKALFLIGYDSYVRPAFNMASHMQQQGWECTAHHLDMGDNPLSETQKQPFASLATLNADALAKLCRGNRFDTIFLGFGGRPVVQLCDELQSLTPQSRVVTFFPGISWCNHYNGFLSRALSDVVLCNTPRDYEYYQRLAEIYGFDGSNAHFFGYPQIYAVTRRPPVRSCDDIRTITYFDQNIIPKTGSERHILARKLVDLARHFPDKTLCVKLRNQPHETTAHDGAHNLRTLIEKAGDVPPNMMFTTGAIEECIARTDLALSISSTVLVETLARGILSYAIADFGIRDDYGIPYFLESGIIKTFAAIQEGVITYPPDAWIDANASGIEMRMAILTEPQQPKRPRAVSEGLQDYFALDYQKRANRPLYQRIAIALYRKRARLWHMPLHRFSRMIRGSRR